MTYNSIKLLKHLPLGYPDSFSSFFRYTLGLRKKGAGLAQEGYIKQKQCGMGKFLDTGSCGHNSYSPMKETPGTVGSSLTSYLSGCLST